MQNRRPISQLLNRYSRNNVKLEHRVEEAVEERQSHNKCKMLGDAIVQGFIENVTHAIHNVSIPNMNVKCFQN